MNGVRPGELLELLRALDQEGASSLTPPVMVTVVSRAGSVYDRAGAMAVFVSGGGSRTGVLDLIDVEPELAARVRAVAESGRPSLVKLALRDDSAMTSWGLGAPGEVELFLEQAGGAVREQLEEARRELLEGKGVVISLEVDGPEAGRRQRLAAEDPAVADCYREMSPELVESRKGGALRRHLVIPIHPMGKALIFGSGRDAASLARHLHELGFSVFVGDPRPGRLASVDWDRRWATLIEGGWERVRSAAGPDEETVVVVMTRSYALDLETLQGALVSPASYVGSVGSEQRALRLAADLAKLGVRARPGQWRAPAGLDVGAEAPRETALAVAAEILAARWGRKGGRLSSRKVAVHVPDPEAAGKPKVPGLILAAGRGRRFGGQKLAASVDGQPVLRLTVQNALASSLDPVIVVLGYEAGRALEALRGLDDPKLRVVFNPRWEGGKGSSIECGLREVPASATGVVSLLGDMPRVSPSLIDRVVAEFDLAGKLVFPVYQGPGGATKGYPTAFPRSLFGEIRALTGDDTAAEAIRRHWAEAVKIHLKDGRTQADVDTAEDLELLAQAPSGGQGLESH
jgi:CTP:molybdopterin cytidylyltransferase MocA/xanthine/CO dehydrogenase XdhC/CoxF family maturation factor